MTPEAIRRAVDLQEASRAASNIKVGHLLALLGEGEWPVWLGMKMTETTIALTIKINQNGSDTASAAAREKMGIVT